jgi:hypothetical protein
MGGFGREAFDLGIRYLGICCGAGPHHIRALAEALGRHPQSSKYSADMSKHAYFEAAAGKPAGFQLKCGPLQREMIQQLCTPILCQRFVNQKDKAGTLATCL